MNVTRTTPTGKDLAITTAPFNDAHALLKSILQALKGLPLSADLLKMDLSVLKEAVLSVASSEAVEAAIFKCYERVTWNSLRVTRELFDDVKLGDQAREDFYFIAWEVIQANCQPFFARTFSELKTRLETSVASPKSSS